MKILAIEKELAIIPQEKAEAILKDEARKVWDLSKKGIIREIYFTEKKTAVLVMEAKSAKDAKLILDELPLVQQRYILFDIMELHAYSGYDRLF